MLTTTDAEKKRLSAWAPRLQGTLINPRTLLATDYLNHFNEMIMLIGMTADMPEVIDDIQQWRMKSYAEHFRNSGLTYGALAAAAYDDAPAAYKSGFERTIQQIVLVIDSTRERLKMALAAGDMDDVRDTSTSAAMRLTNLVGAASAIIAGDQETKLQSEIDKQFGG